MSKTFTQTTNATDSDGTNLGTLRLRGDDGRSTDGSEVSSRTETEEEKKARRRRRKEQANREERDRRKSKAEGTNTDTDTDTDTKSDTAPKRSSRSRSRSRSRSSDTSDDTDGKRSSSRSRSRSRSRLRSKGDGSDNDSDSESESNKKRRSRKRSKSRSREGGTDGTTTDTTTTTPTDDTTTTTTSKGYTGVPRTYEDLSKALETSTGPDTEELRRKRVERYAKPKRVEYQSPERRADPWESEHYTSKPSRSSGVTSAVSGDSADTGTGGTETGSETDSSLQSEATARTDTSAETKSAEAKREKVKEIQKRRESKSSDNKKSRSSSQVTKVDGKKYFNFNDDIGGKVRLWNKPIEDPVKFHVDSTTGRNTGRERTPWADLVSDYEFTATILACATQDQYDTFMCNRAKVLGLDLTAEQEAKTWVSLRSDGTMEETHCKSIFNYVRHDQGYHNVNGLLPAEMRRSHCDPSLTPQGRKWAKDMYTQRQQLEEAGIYKADMCFSSPSIRAIETAEAQTGRSFTEHTPGIFNITTASLREQKGSGLTSQFPNMQHSLAYDGSSAGYTDPWWGTSRENLSDLAWRGENEFPALVAKATAVFLGMLSPSEFARRQASTGGLSVSMDGYSHCEAIGGALAKFDNKYAENPEKAGEMLRPSNSENRIYEWDVTLSSVDVTAPDWNADLYAKSKMNSFGPRRTGLENVMSDVENENPKAKKLFKDLRGYEDMKPFSIMEPAVDTTFGSAAEAA